MKDFEKIFQYNNTSQLINKNILITGANGLIGSYLVEYFCYLNETYNYNIKLILTSKSEAPKRLKDLIEKYKLTYFSKNLAENSNLSLPYIDYCFYCAGYAQPSKFIKLPTDTLLLNTTGVHNIFKEIFIKNNLATCVFLSSSEVYSNNTKQSAHQEEDLINIDINNKRNCYILGKLCGESVVNNFRNNGFNAISARVSLCYGPGVMQDDARVLSEIVLKGLKDPFIKLFDNGSAERRYLHISDFTLMLLNITLKGKHSVYNIGGEENCTILELATIVGNFLNKEVIKNTDNNIVTQSAPRIVWNSLERYKVEFGKINYKSLKNGVEEFIKWYSDTYKITL